MKPQYRDSLQKYELTEEEWRSIELVKGWLRLFRDATLVMSSSKESTLSEVHAIFKDLQTELTSALAELSDDAPIQLRTGLLNAHRKLSDYYYKFDQSPYYIWAASKS